MRAFLTIGAVAAAVVLVTGGAALTAQDAGGSLNKPLARFTIGDLFPQMTGGMRDIAASWKGAGDNSRTLAAAQLKNIREAQPQVKAQLDSAKKDAKAAEKNKDFVAAGTAQGQVKSGEAVLDVLNRLENVTSTQGELADAWGKTGDMLRKFADADEAFDRYRSSGIARPDTGKPDTRLNKDGFDAFRNRAQALRDLGEAFYQLSVKTRNLADGQLKLADDLQKGGSIQTPVK
jgi:hypothetical protein